MRIITIYSVKTLPEQVFTSPIKSFELFQLKEFTSSNITSLGATHKKS